VAEVFCFLSERQTSVVSDSANEKAQLKVQRKLLPTPYIFFLHSIFFKNPIIPCCNYSSEM